MWGRPPVLSSHSARLMRTDLLPAKEGDPERPVWTWNPADDEGLGLRKWLVVAAVAAACIAFAWIVL